MKPTYPKMLPPPKTEKERLRYRILEPEAENAILKKLQELKQTIHNYIHYDNNERIQVKLKGLRPVKYRTQSLK